MLQIGPNGLVGQFLYLPARACVCARVDAFVEVPGAFADSDSGVDSDDRFVRGRDG